MLKKEQSGKTRKGIKSSRSEVRYYDDLELLYNPKQHQSISASDKSINLEDNGARDNKFDTSGDFQTIPAIPKETKELYRPRREEQPEVTLQVLQSTDTFSTLPPIKEEDETSIQSVPQKKPGVSFPSILPKRYSFDLPIAVSGKTESNNEDLTAAIETQIVEIETQIVHDMQELEDDVYRIETTNDERQLLHQLQQHIGNVHKAYKKLQQEKIQLKTGGTCVPKPLPRNLFDLSRQSKQIENIKSRVDTYLETMQEKQIQELINLIDVIKEWYESEVWQQRHSKRFTHKEKPAKVKPIKHPIEQPVEQPIEQLEETENYQFAEEEKIKKKKKRTTKLKEKDEEEVEQKNEEETDQEIEEEEEEEKEENERKEENQDSSETSSNDDYISTTRFFAKSESYKEEEYEQDEIFTDHMDYMQEDLSSPTKRAEYYLSSRYILQFFRFLGAHLVAAVPENPIAYLIDLLERCCHYRDGLCTPPLLFEMRHVESLYQSLDPMGEGEINVQQYFTGMFTLGITDYIPNPELNTRCMVDRKTFIADACKKLIEQFNKMVELPGETPVHLSYMGSTFSKLSPITRSCRSG